MYYSKFSVLSSVKKNRKYFVANNGNLFKISSLLCRWTRCGICMEYYIEVPARYGSACMYIYISIHECVLKHFALKIYNSNFYFYTHMYAPFHPQNSGSDNDQIMYSLTRPNHLLLPCHHIIPKAPTHATTATVYIHIIKLPYNYSYFHSSFPQDNGLKHQNDTVYETNILYVTCYSDIWYR